ncbi:hypothetical protein PRIPAC_86497 [Pristionchus pacificus]|nr:hypothetical protein PRIPAC_86497 [Pristionchus pacificus]
MSWLSKVSDLAGKAEEMLVRMDQNAGSAIAQAKVQGKTSSTVSLNRTQPEPTITEEIGRSEPSHAHSDFIKPQKKKQPTAGYAPSTSVLPEHRDANLISFLNDPDVEEMEMGKSTYSVHSITEATDLVLVNNLRSQLAAKDTQMEILKSTNTQLEKRLEEEKLKLKRSEEKVKESAQQATPSVSNESLIKERSALQSELSNLKKRVASQEEQMSAVNDQLRLAKFNLTENKKEFDGYKEKAQKILQTKEKLIESLKSEGGSEEKSNGVLLAQIEELKLERDLARSDLESAQVMVYNMRGEVDEAENAAREARNALSEMKRRINDETHSQQINLTLWKEKAECARSEVEVIRVERETERSEWQRKIDEKEAELIGLRDEVRRKRSIQAPPEDGGRSTMLLLQKEEELREANREKQILRVRLERLEKQSKETVVQMGEIGQSSGGMTLNRGGSQSHNFLQSIMMKGVSTLRGSSTARSYFAGYLLTIHLLLFFIIITYTPESHGGDSPSNPTHDHG